MEINFPFHITLLFEITVVVTIVWFYFASKSKTAFIILCIWVIIQSILARNGFFQNTEMVPPRLMLFGVFPSLALILVLFLTKWGKAFIDGIDLKAITSFHTIRVPVEITLVLLYYGGWVSEYMTYEGTNFDIFSGITAPFVAIYAVRHEALKPKRLLTWNIICLLLLFNVVITAIFALPSPFQKLAFDQPNLAVLYFPFNLLPSVVVPLVLFAHLVAIRQS
jgi:hypothetical protein